MKDSLINKLLRYPGALAMRVRIAWLRLLGARFEGKCWIRKIEIPRNPWDIQVQESSLDNHVVLLTTGERTTTPRIIIRHGTYINRFTMIDASERIEIGQRCMIGPYCYITDHDHGFAGTGSIQKQQLIGSPVSIEDDAWLGAGVTVLKGVTIGTGAIVGAGAVVTRDVPAFSKVAGVPARSIGSRAAVQDAV